MTVRPRGTGYRPTAVPVVGDSVAPLPTVGFIADPYELSSNVVPIEPGPACCVHGAPAGTSCIYCQNAGVFDQVPRAIARDGEHELAALLRRLTTEARDNWTADVRAQWRGQWDRYCAWYLARRLLTAPGITVDVGV